jgi:hypothetical protein
MDRITGASYKGLALRYEHGFQKMCLFTASLLPKNGDCESATPTRKCHDFLLYGSCSKKDQW